MYRNRPGIFFSFPHTNNYERIILLLLLLYVNRIRRALGANRNNRVRLRYTLFQPVQISTTPEMLKTKYYIPRNRRDNHYDRRYSNSWYLYCRKWQTLKKPSSAANPPRTYLYACADTRWVCRRWKCETRT